MKTSHVIFFLILLLILRSRTAAPAAAVATTSTTPDPTLRRDMNERYDLLAERLEKLEQSAYA